MNEAWGPAALRICGIFIGIGLATMLIVDLIGTTGGSAQSISLVRLTSLVGAYGASVAALFAKPRRR